jgi:hypothetical protein
MEDHRNPDLPNPKNHGPMNQAKASQHPARQSKRNRQYSQYMAKAIAGAVHPFLLFL